MPGLQSEHVRALVDAVEPVLVEEVASRTSPVRADRRPGPVLVAAAVLLVVVAVAGAVWIARPGGEERAVRPQPAQTADGPPDACVVTEASRSGCPMALDEAERLLGFAVRTPRVLPEGWQQVRGHFKVYQEPVPEEEGPAPVAPMYLYNMAWTPPGTDLDAPGVCPSLLHVRQRMAHPSEGQVTGRQLELPDGSVVGGYVGPATCGSGGPFHTSAQAWWVADGVWISVDATDVEHDEFVRIVESMR